MVMGSHGQEVRVATIHPLGIDPGDTVEFIPYQGARPGNATVVKIEPDEPATAEEKKFVEHLPLDENIRRGLLSPEAKFFKIKVNRPVALPMGSGICASGRVGNGCVVRDCNFGFNRSRGIIIKASDAKVTGNRITHTWMTAVLVGPEFFWWLEAACPDNALITDNTIIGCRYPAIEITARGGDGNALPAGALRDIVVRDNSILQSPWPNIRVTSTTGLVLKNNRLTPADDQTMVRPLPGRWDWGKTQPTAILLEK
jgi:hypothetical protein